MSTEPVGPEPISPEPISAEPPRPVRLVTMRQDWLDAVFLHWETDPAAAAAWLPDGTRLDAFGGRTFVGLIGLRIRVAVLGVLPVPYLGAFPEVNVRLYTVDRDCRRGIVFCSLDAARMAPAMAGRAGYGLPYMWSDGLASRDGDVMAYSFRRYWPGPGHPKTAFDVRIGDRIDRPSEFQHFLTARWSLHWSRAALTWRAAAAHPPWPLHSAELLSVDDELIGAAALPPPTGDPVSVLWSPGVRAHIGPPVPVRGGVPPSTTMAMLMGL